MHHLNDRRIDFTLQTIITDEEKEINYFCTEMGI